MSVVSRQDQNGIAIVSVDNPPVNALSQAVRAGILDHVEAAAADNAISAILVICAGRTFIAGADITEFGKPPLDPWLPEVVNRIEAVAKPLVAAIHGTALGGGLEIALGCHYRVAAGSARVGTPEVNLGLLPGAGGTQRLPRLTSLKIALDMVVGGKPMAARKAHDAGIIDEIIDGDLLEGALLYCQNLVREGKGPRPTSANAVHAGADPQSVFREYRKKMARRTRGYFAPERCVQAIEASLIGDFEAGLKMERRLFAECMNSPHSKALQHAFFAERAAAKIPGVPKDISIRDIASVGIIGAGTMGGGIAMNFLNAGIPVTLLEVSRENLDRGIAVMRKNYEITASKGRMTMDQVEACMGLITPTTSYDDLGQADLIIEAVFEQMEIKKEVFSKLDTVAKAGAILATNTSYLNVDEIAAATSRPGDVLGMHFFSPANIMRLLEVVRTENTAPEVLASVMKLIKRIKKVGVLSGVCHGFIGNRMFEGYVREALLLLLEGASPRAVDKAIYDFGMPMGPISVIDLAGIDIGYMIRKALPADRFDPHAYRVPNRLVEMGRKGQKTGAGFYNYESGNRAPIDEPLVDGIINEEAAAAGIKRRQISNEEIVARCIYPLINEGARILEEGIAARASDIDVVWMNGYGFPPYRGGPMHYADNIGLGAVLKTIEGFKKQYGDRWWAPAALLVKLASDGQTFGEWKA
jgi:3-hydroxyacyl-CoA dehydrogenase